MINDCRGDKASTYMGFIFTPPHPPAPLFPLELSFCIVTVIKGFISS